MHTHYFEWVRNEEDRVNKKGKIYSLYNTFLNSKTIDFLPNFLCPKRGFIYIMLFKLVFINAFIILNYNFII